MSQDLMDGLSNAQKSIPCRYYYDDLGSRLFEEQCKQPEYYLYRTEKKILERQSEKILKACSVETFVDLGCGNCEKTEMFLRTSISMMRYPLLNMIDINGLIVEEASQRLSQTLPTLNTVKLVGDYAATIPMHAHRIEPSLFFFLGSNIGNMTDDEILRFMNMCRTGMRDGDYILIGHDLDKDPALLTAAYNDKNGVAAKTNLNVLSNLNNQYAGNIDISAFRHEAAYYPEGFTMKSHLVALRDTMFTLPKLKLTVSVKAGERILTEIERKFPMGYLEQLLELANFKLVEEFHDDNAWFAVSLFRDVCRNDRTVSGASGLDG
ncbi:MULTISPECIES: L-histidine N(alpha)-methyltransferase [Rhizobium]|nr:MULTISPECIES: L-histidine N(alpha)-methyltransferase [Rhizobium]MCS0463221.1 L-histidine N(alpha)-methyltransferase [Rhizobium favelukesii]UFS84695.1 L-histidine N(alpha)-methyltransferase [Rhizobium sp. T136]